MYSVIQHGAIMDILFIDWRHSGYYAYGVLIVSWGGINVWCIVLIVISYLWYHDKLFGFFTIFVKRISMYLPRYLAAHIILGITAANIFCSNICDVLSRFFLNTIYSYMNYIYMCFIYICYICICICRPICIYILHL